MSSGVLGLGVLMSLALVHYSLTGESYGSLAGGEQVERETGSLGIPNSAPLLRSFTGLVQKRKKSEMTNLFNISFFLSYTAKKINGANKDLKSPEKKTPVWLKSSFLEEISTMSLILLKTFLIEFFMI